MLRIDVDCLNNPYLLHGWTVLWHRSKELPNSMSTAAHSRPHKYGNMQCMYRRPATTELMRECGMSHLVGWGSSGKGGGVPTHFSPALPPTPHLQAWLVLPLHNTHEGHNTETNKYVNSRFIPQVVVVVVVEVEVVVVAVELMSLVVLEVVVVVVIML